MSLRTESLRQSQMLHFISLAGKEGEGWRYKNWGEMGEDDPVTDASAENSTTLQAAFKKLKIDPEW